MISLAELVELVVLMAISMVLVVRVIFRPTVAPKEKTRSAAVGREAMARHVLGSTPTKAATRIYGKLLRDADRAGLVIDWDRARREQAATAPRTTLLSAARRQISQPPELALSATPKR